MVSDGAAALVLVSGVKALELGLQVIAKIRGFADAAQVGQKIFLVFILILGGFLYLVLKQFFNGRLQSGLQLLHPLQYQKP